MSIRTFSARDFTRDVSTAKRAAIEGPVFITDRGRPAFALLKIEDYYSLAGRGTQTLLSVMDAIPSGEDIDFNPRRLSIESRAASFD